MGIILAKKQECYSIRSNNVGLSVKLILALLKYQGQVNENQIGVSPSTEMR